jgi:nitrous oxidase accessory protein NosD
MSSRKPLLVILIVLIMGAVAGVWITHPSGWDWNSTDVAGQTSSLPRTGVQPGVQGTVYPGDPEREARLVNREEERLVYVRTVASAAKWKVTGLDGGYRFQTGDTFTLVLPARDQPYTVADLLTLAPKTFVRQPDGSYLLSENIAVLPGATLSLASPEGLNLHLKSDPESFVSIIGLGGSVTLTGTAAAPASVTSWNSGANGPDITTDDGRAYIRVIGGRGTVSYAHITELGFWSGNTGGLALTGTDTLNTFNPVARPGAPVASDGADGAPLVPNKDATAISSPSGKEYSLVTGEIDNAQIDGNAYGLFVTNAQAVVVRDSSITGSLVDGLAVHRAVSDMKVTRTTASHNNVDGFSVDRSSTHVVYQDVTASGNGRDGITVDGEPLAAGPNAVGTSVDEYGDNQVIGSTITDNARYGVKFSGGYHLKISGSTVAHNAVGVVVDHGATDVDITGNTFEGQSLQAVAIRDGDTGANVATNTITGGDTGVYVRNAQATVNANRITAVSNHGITLFESLPDTRVWGNSVAGYGSTPVWSSESTTGTVGVNNVDGWHRATTVETVAKSLFSPLTFVWLFLAALLVVSAFTRRRHVGGIRDPYAEHTPLTALSRGIVPAAMVRRDR